ncbi:hypothetical protein ACFY4C_34635 [Actinomadura viridis]|uniref:hypothetical protein n=1 Tax=Actinomadura viridis TaxID=58110 RepID=UPI0036BAFCF1
MTVGRTTPRLRHEPAGLLMALFLVAGLIFSYGLGHAPALRVCTTHSVSVPADVAAAMAAHQTASFQAGSARPAGATAEALRAGTLPGALGHGAAAPSGPSAFSTPFDPPPFPPVETCLCLAVLIGLMALGLAAKPRRAGPRRPPRSGWTLAPPAFAPPSPLSLTALQVLRL